MTASHYRWVIVAAGGLLGCLAIGSAFSLPVFLLPISRDTGWSVAGISSAMTLSFVAMAVASVGWGALSDRVGPRVVVMTGSILLAASLALASRAPSLIAFQLIFGLAVGVATAAMFAPMMACVTGWFDTHRSLAVSLVSAGMGMAPIVMSPFVAWLVTVRDWRTSLLIVAGVAAAIMIPASLLVRRPPALASRRGAGRGCAATRDLRRAGGAIAAVRHPAADQLLLLRHALGPDLPHRQLCRDLRHSDGRRRLDLQRRRAGRHGWPRRLRHPRRPPRGQAGSRLGPAAPGVRRARLRLCPPAWRVLRRRQPVRLRLCRRHAPLRRARARELSAFA